MDNILLIKNIQKEIDKIKCIFLRKFKMKNLGLVSWHLGLTITHDLLASKMFISQALYVEKILKNSEM